MVSDTKLCESVPPRDNVVLSLYCGVVVLYDGDASGTQCVEPRLKRDVQSHGMR